MWRKKKTLGDALTSDAWVTPSDASVPHVFPMVALSSLRKKYKRKYRIGEMTLLVLHILSGPFGIHGCILGFFQ